MDSNIRFPVTEIVIEGSNANSSLRQTVTRRRCKCAQRGRFAPDSLLEEAGFEPSVPRQGTAFFTEGNELYPLPINHQVGDHASGEKRLSRGRRNRCQRLRSLH